MTDRSEQLVYVLNLAADMNPTELSVLRGIAETMIESAPMPCPTENLADVTARVATALESSLLVLSTAVARLRQKVTN